jgi:hypothetical protein
VRGNPPHLSASASFAHSVIPRGFINSSTGRGIGASSLCSQASHAALSILAWDKRDWGRLVGPLFFTVPSSCLLVVCLFSPYSYPLSSLEGRCLPALFIPASCCSGFTVRTMASLDPRRKYACWPNPSNKDVVTCSLCGHSLVFTPATLVSQLGQWQVQIQGRSMPAGQTFLTKMW